MVIASITLSLLVAVGAAPQDAPIVKPGAPGEKSERLSPAESAALAKTRYTAADARFMQHMIVHHAQAVEMVALIAERSTHDGVARMGARISASQASEIEFMKSWLAARGEKLEMQHEDGAHPGMAMMKRDPDTPVMAGMLSPNEMKQLAAADGVEFDRLFLSGMIKHHQGALDMVDALLETPNAGEDPALSEFLSSVVAHQSAEILRMQTMLSAL